MFSEGSDVKRILIFLLILTVLLSGCVGNAPQNSGKTTEKVSSSPTESETFSGQTSTGTSQTATTTEKPGGTATLKLFNESRAVNLSLVPEETINCVQKAPEVIQAYYSAVKSEEDVSPYFDLSVVDNTSLKELHEALYRAVDFKELTVSGLNCSVASSQLVACSYHYSATLEKDGETRHIERDYVTFLTGDECRIIWTEESG